jgi:hypothetical protein
MEVHSRGAGVISTHITRTPLIYDGLLLKLLLPFCNIFYRALDAIWGKTRPIPPVVEFVLLFHFPAPFTMFFCGEGLMVWMSGSMVSKGGAL